MKNQQFYTSLIQSKRLQDMGLDPETADMCWIADDDLRFGVHPAATPWRDFSAKQYYVPCWSVGALLSVLPDSIVKNEMKCYISVTSHGITYHHGPDPDQRYLNITWSENPNLIDACYQCVSYMIGNGYIQKV